MKQVLLFLSASALFAGSAFAADAASGAAKTPSPAQAAQQEKMKACNKDAGDKKGDERKAFMKDCLSASATPAQQEKMKTCNKDAGDKKGDERKAFMKDCLSAKKS
ncbi:PsiF family protein [Roseateles violae]|uniref:PsiF family protein n=1 Tax=Roseateles violae TaxID=3058042 RepID=A0ABT8DKC8_9BURK|nr:PsiF family protein [Pelomonas sp. PFR6]MDN3918881.1 PsiF family protein [Pelomonas sp. PFR6]